MIKNSSFTQTNNCPMVFNCQSYNVNVPKVQLESQSLISKLFSIIAADHVAIHIRQQKIILYIKIFTGESYFSPNELFIGYNCFLYHSQGKQNIACNINKQPMVGKDHLIMSKDTLSFMLVLNKTHM